MNGMHEKVREAAAFLRSQTNLRPRLAVILGSGLGALAEEMTDRCVIPYCEIPHFPVSNVSGHAARLVVGRLGEAVVAAMQGRFHFYEGLSMREVAFPVFVLREFGVGDLIVTNACGGISDAFRPGDLMLIGDHINLLGANPLIGENDDRFGPRFPDMTEVYDRTLLDFAERTAEGLGIAVRRGVYALFPGPCYETAAEIRAYRTLGADAVGMSTVPEATAAHYLGMRVLGISCITNMATGIAKTKHSHEEVLAAAEAGGERFRALLRELARNWATA